MKIAVPTNDGTSISRHFGRSAAFLVFDIQDGKLAARDVRPNDGQHHGHHGDQCKNDSQAARAHNHSGIIGSIADCDVVLSSGMGQGAVEALKSCGITTVFVDETGAADQIVESYLAGTAKIAQGSSCHCSH